MRKFRTAVARLSVLLVAFCLVFVAVSQYANADRSLVTDPDSINTAGTATGVDFYAEISQQRGSNNLEALQSYALFSYTSATNNQFRIGYCRDGIDRNCALNVSRNEVEIQICALDISPSSTIKPLYRVKDNNGASCYIIQQPAADTLHTIPIAGKQSTANNRYNYMAMVRFLNNNPDAASYPLHAFRLRAANNGGTAGFFPQQQLDFNQSVTQFVIPNRDTFLAVQNRNQTYNQSGTSHRDQIRFRFRTDCLVNPRGLSNEDRKVPLKWSDADAKPGSDPDNSINPSISWRIINDRTGQVLTSADRAFWTSRAVPEYMGGQGETREDKIPWSTTPGGGFGTFYYEAGDPITWEWNNVLANNGVQIQMPFEDFNITDECPPRYNSARCDVSGVPDIMGSGETRTVTVRVRNGRFNDIFPSTTWTPGGNFKLGSGAYPPADVNGEPAYFDSRFWQASQSSGGSPVENKNRVRVTENIYPENLFPDRQSLATFTFNITAPPGRSGAFPFLWQMLEETGFGPTRFGEICNKTIEIKDNKPFLRVSGGDVLSGAVFGNGDVCSAYRTPPTDPRVLRAMNAKINTYGYAPYDLTGIYGSASSQYAVFASGLIGNEGEELNNFLGNSGNSGDGGYLRGGVKDLLFANAEGGKGKEHGKFYSGPNELPCVDISQAEQAATTKTSPINGATVPSQQREVWLVNGPLTITGNITYRGPDNAANNSPNYGQATNIPYLMIIAKGPIYITSNVTRIDAHLVAYPIALSDPKSGLIDTCSNAPGMAQGEWLGSLTVASCERQLVINGSLRARKILWKGTYGTIGESKSVIDTTCPVLITGSGYDVNRLKSCAAEHIDFSAEAYLANPLIEQDNPEVGNVPNNTTELPPIY